MNIYKVLSARDDNYWIIVAAEDEWDAQEVWDEVMSTEVGPVIELAMDAWDDAERGFLGEHRG